MIRVKGWCEISKYLGLELGLGLRLGLKLGQEAMAVEEALLCTQSFVGILSAFIQFDNHDEGVSKSRCRYLMYEKRNVQLHGHDEGYDEGVSKS